MNTYCINSLTIDRNNRAILKISTVTGIRFVTVSVKDLKTIFGLNNIEGLKYIQFPTAEFSLRETTIVSEDVDITVAEYSGHHLITAQEYSSKSNDNYEIFVNKDFEDVCDYLMSII